MVEADKNKKSTRSGEKLRSFTFTDNYQIFPIMENQFKRLPGNYMMRMVEFKGES